jgi:hypothetical protein
MEFACGQAPEFAAERPLGFGNKLLRPDPFLVVPAPLAFSGSGAENIPKIIKMVWPDGMPESYGFTAGVPRITLDKVR